LYRGFTERSIYWRLAKYDRMTHDQRDDDSPAAVIRIGRDVRVASIGGG
jgi:hypothetical protein